MLTTLDRYLLREIARPFAAGMGLFFAVAAFAQVLKVSDALTGIGIGAADLLAALCFSLPPLVGLLVPVSCLFATLLGVGRLAADRELLALWAAGVSPYRLLKVPLLLGTVLGAISCLALVYGEPWGIKGLRSRMARGAQRALADGMLPGTFHEWLPGLTLYAAGRDGDILREVIFADRRDPDQPRLAFAARGQLHQGERTHDLLFTLHDGTLLLAPPTPDDATRPERLIHFAHSTIRLDVGSLVGNKARNLSGAQEKTLAGLDEEGHDLRLSQNVRGLFLVTLHRKFAVPLAALIFALLAVPLCAGARGAARARGFLWSTAIVAAYYYVGRAFELAARGGQMSPVLAAWLPDMAGAVALCWGLWHMRRAGA